MITMTCKCGTTIITFDRLSASDFPKEWTQECCKKLDVKEPVVIEEKITAEVIDAENTSSVESSYRKKEKKKRD